MSEDTGGHEAPTRRDYMKYGGAVVGGGLLAGCAGQSDSGSTPESTSTETATSTTSEEGESWSVELKPSGTQAFTEVPESVTVYGNTWWGIIASLGHLDAVRGVGNPYSGIASYYNTLDIDVDDSQYSYLMSQGADKADLERFFEVDPDLNIIDPHNAKANLGLDDSDIDQISQDIAPFFGSYIRRPDFTDGHPYYSLYEAVEKAGQIFQEQERAAALRSVYEDAKATLDSVSPDEPIEVGYLQGSPTDGTFFIWKPGLPGVQGKTLRDIGVSDAFEGRYPDGKNWYKGDYEDLLEVDPEIIVIKSGIRIHSWRTGDNFAEYRQAFEVHETGSQLTAVQNDSVYAGGSITQGPVQNLFHMELVAKQLFQDSLGEFTFESFDSLASLSADEQLFDRQRVVDIVNGEL
jgi:iron complex transport system substrate-binding protein